ncbi:MAG: O-antigen ligase family protein [Lachnospiraceae bacterium]|nr:O-antigen ligase family protein [Lachnospiraceae bacterium]
MRHTKKISLIITGENLLGFLVAFDIAAYVCQTFIYVDLGIIYIEQVITILSSFLIMMFTTKIIPNTFLKGYFAFFLFAAMSIFWSSSTSVYYMRVRDIFSCLLLALNITQYCFVTCDKNDIKKRANNVLSFFLIFVCIMTVYCYYVAGSDILSWARLGKDVYVSGNSSFILYTCYLTLASYIAIARIFTSDKKNIYIILSVLLYASCVFTGVRKLMVLPFLFLYFFLLYRYRNNAAKILGVTIGVGVLAVLAVWIIMHYSSSMATRINQLLLGLSGSANQEASYSERSLLASLAWKCFKEHPIIGYAIGQFRIYSVHHGGPELYAHCNWLEILADLGIIGFAIYYGTQFIILVRAYKKQSIVCCFVFAFILANMFSDIFQVSYYYDGHVVLFAVCSCLLLSDYIKDDKSQQSES